MARFERLKTPPPLPCGCSGAGPCVIAARIIATRLGGLGSADVRWGLRLHLAVSLGHVPSDSREWRAYRRLGRQRDRSRNDGARRLARKRAGALDNSPPAKSP